MNFSLMLILIFGLFIIGVFIAIIATYGSNNSKTKNMEQYPLIRKIYLYLFALVGLTLMVISGVQFLNIALKMTIFKEADRQQAIYQKMPSCGPLAADRVESIVNRSNEAKVSVELTEAERTAMASWLQNYKSWQEEYENYDPIRANREQTAANALAMLIIGLPLYLYHWRVIKRETKK